MGIEPTRPAWKAGILAIELHPHFEQRIVYHKMDSQSSIFLKKFKNFKKQNYIKETLVK